MESEKTEKKIKSLGFTLKIKENKKKEVKKNTLFDAKNFRKPFEEDVVYNDDIKVKEELIKEVEGRKIHAVHEIEEKGPLVIPLIKTNQWRNNVNNDTNNKVVDDKEKNKDQDKNDEKKKIDEVKENKIETEEEIEDKGIDLKSKYGLQIPVKKRKLNEENEEKVEITKVEDKKEEIIEDNRTLEEKAIDAIKRESKMEMENDLTSKSSIDAIPILKQNAVPGTENFTSETEKFRYDIQFRPEESTLEDYERIPIEEFGAAMLRGMGWEKGKAVGRNRNNKNAMVEPIQFIPRPALLGLGAQPVPPDLDEMKKKRKRNTMAKEEPPKEYKPHIGSDGKVKHFKTLDEKLHNRSTSSRHRDSSSHSHHRHSSHRSKSRDRDYNKNKNYDSDSSSSSSSNSSHKKESKYTRSSDTHNHSRDHSRHRSHDESSTKHHRSSSSSYHESYSNKQNSWLYPNIRVRIVSKSFKSGKYYKKKGVIFDVTQQGECILRLDNGKLLENVKERYLETLIPEINEIIMVVRHTPYVDEDYYQKVGKVLTKDRNTEKAMIQLEPSMDVVMLSFDDICEFKGNTNDFY